MMVFARTLTLSADRPGESRRSSQNMTGYRPPGDCARRSIRLPTSLLIASQHTT